MKLPYLVAALLFPLALPTIAQEEPATTTAQSQPDTQSDTQPAVGRGAPPDLRTLLAAPQSEMRLVTLRYTSDRTLLSRFYEIPTNRNLQTGRGASPTAAPQSPSLSTKRIARLKRFDMDWSTALEQIDAAKLSPAAQTDLQTLKTNLQNNRKQLDAQTIAQAKVMPLVPFAPAILQLEESRRAMTTMDAEKSATTLAQTTRDIAAFRKTLDAALADEAGRANIPMSKSTATSAAAAVDGLQATLKDWFAYYNDYDPMFTWWMPHPYKEIDAALADYAAFLRAKVIPSAKEIEPAIDPDAIAASASPPWNEVPDLQELLTFPQNELINIDQRFTGGGGGGGGRGGGRGGRSPELVAQWQAALKQLDFDRLSRNAQLDYLRIRNNLDVAARRATTPPQANIPRKEQNEMLNGQRLIAPVGEQALQLLLADEMIPYTPQQLLLLAESEFKWCDAEVKRASLEMGCGGDLVKAMEVAKNNHVPAGKQPDLIRDIMHEDVAFLRKNDLVTIPEIDYETIQMVMMSAQQQLVNPYFTGGARISVSYPLPSMTTQQRLESMRGNNVAFARATVHHELIPGHNLTWYLTPRYSPVRGGDMGATPFFNEGWAVYWEMRLYDSSFARGPEDRMGFLFWRMMRCARIVFSLNYHLGLMSGHECVDYLVNRIASERENAAAEVTRSFNGSYAPLYQAGYLLGAIQFRSLQKEFVQSGQMTDKQFHDAVLRQPQMPVSLVRLALTKEKPTRDYAFDWKFYGPLDGK